MAAINRAACRTIHHHTPDCPCLDEDEVAIVRLVAALAHGAVGEARAIALGLVRPEGRGASAGRGRCAGPAA